MMTSAAGRILIDDPVPTEQLQRIAGLDNNALIIRLLFTIHHLSRWLSPIHDQRVLERTVRRGEPSPKQLVLALRDYERRIYPRMYLIASHNDPDLDELPEVERTDAQRRMDEADSALVVMAAFRRLRQTSTSLLRALPDDAWARRGAARQGGIEGTIRSMAEALAIHDYRVLRVLERSLDEVGAREGLAALQVTPLDDLLQLVPDGGVDLSIPEPRPHV